MPCSTIRRTNGWTNQSTEVISEFIYEICGDRTIADDLARVAAHGDVAGWIAAAKRYVSGELERHCGADHFGTRMAFAAVNDADWRQLADNNIRMVDAVERTIAQRTSFADRVVNGRGDARGRA